MESRTTGSAPEGQRIQVHAPPTLEYHYRDLFNVFASPEEIVIEFGNRQRNAPDHATVGDRIVLSHANAHRLQATLQRTLEHVREEMQKRKEQQ